MNVGDVAELKAPMFKAVSAWIAALGTSAWESWHQVPWDKFAQFAAFVYSVCLIIEFVRKRRLKERRKGDRHGTE